jgi:hypothetical protein
MTKNAGEVAKEDLKKLEAAMNGSAIPERKPGEEVQAATESGARVTITGGGVKVETTTDGLKRMAQVVKGALKENKRSHKAKVKPVQTEAAALVPEMDGVGKAANRLAAAVRAKEEAAEEYGEAESNLIRALKKVHRTSFKADGITMLLQHKGPVDKIAIQKPK